MTGKIIYEQPTNETTRICLRLEYLFQKALHSLHGATGLDSTHTLSAIIDILTVLDRPDLKVKLAKELSRYQESLLPYLQYSHVDRERLTQIIRELEKACNELKTTKNRFGEALYQNEFLNNVKLYLQTPAGTAPFNLPAFYYWQHWAPEIRIQQLTEWLKEFEPIRSATALLLKLIRQSNSPKQFMAPQGYYEIQFKPEQPCQLIRIAVPEETHAYPEISIGKHRACIRFVSQTERHGTVKSLEDVAFELTCCVV